MTAERQPPTGTETETAERETAAVMEEETVAERSWERKVSCELVTKSRWSMAPYLKSAVSGDPCVIQGVSYRPVKGCKCGCVGVKIRSHCYALAVT